MLIVKEYIKDKMLFELVEEIIVSRQYRKTDILKFNFGIYEGSLPVDDYRISDRKKYLNNLLKYLGYTNSYNPNIIHSSLERIMNNLKLNILSSTLKDDASLSEKEINDWIKYDNNIKDKYTLLESIFISALISSLPQRLKTKFYKNNSLSIDERYQIITNLKDNLEYGTIDNMDNYYDRSNIMEYSHFIKYSDYIINRKVFSLVTDKIKERDVNLAFLLDEYNKMRHTVDYMNRSKIIETNDMNELLSIIEMTLNDSQITYNTYNSSIWYREEFKRYIQPEIIMEIIEEDTKGRQSLGIRWEDNIYIIERVADAIIEKCKGNRLYKKSIDMRVTSDFHFKMELRERVYTRLRDDILIGTKKGRESKAKLKKVNESIKNLDTVFNQLIENMVSEWDYINQIANAIAQPMRLELLNLFTIYKNDKVLLNEDAGAFLETNQTIGNNDIVLRLCLEKCNSFFKLGDGMSKELCKRIISKFDQELRNLKETMPINEQNKYEKIYNGDIQYNFYKNHKEVLQLDKENEDIWIAQRKNAVRERYKDVITIDRSNK